MVEGLYNENIFSADRRRHSWMLLGESSWSMILEEPTQSQPEQVIQPENSAASENELVIPAGR